MTVLFTRMTQGIDCGLGSKWGVAVMVTVFAAEMSIFVLKVMETVD
jgi:hypothetical protein